MGSTQDAALWTALIHAKLQDACTLMQRMDITLHDATTEKIEKAICSLSGWETFRINPLKFAEIHGLDPEATLGYFIYGSKTGLFRFEWNLLCPYCGGREHSHQNLNQLEKQKYHCTVCDLDVQVEADNHLEVSFSLHPDLGVALPDPYSSLANYSRYHFSSHLVLSEALAKAFGKQPAREYISVPPQRTCRYAGTIAKLPPAKRMRIVTLETHSIFNAYFTEGQAEQVQRFELVHTEKGFTTPSAQFLAPGRVEIRVVNESPRPIGILSTWANTAELLEAYQQEPAYFLPFVTGKMMLNNQHFRELFLVDNLPDDLSLKVNDITLLFTDLKGSTELYDKTGDVKAYHLVKNHFTILQQIVRRRQGAVVKTMGDAIMASFNTPLHGIDASFEMLDRIQAFNETLQDTENAIGLKIGLHRGAVIAVKANQTLDYFGQAVNIAARVQGLAQAGELWMTQDVRRDPGVSAYLAQRGRVLVPREVVLKGVGNKVEVYQCEAEPCEMT